MILDMLCKALAIHLGRQILPLPVRHWLWAKWENYKNRLPNIGN